jgi:hypothetical protein
MLLLLLLQETWSQRNAVSGQDHMLLCFSVLQLDAQSGQLLSTWKLQTGSTASEAGNRSAQVF